MSSSELLQEILCLEHQVWQALVEGDSAADARLLAPDFLGVYPSGFAKAADHVGQLAEGPTVARYEISETRLLELGPDHVCLSYHARYQRAAPAEETSDWEAMYVSSIWKRQPGALGWGNVFSQDTVADGQQLV